MVARPCPHLRGLGGWAEGLGLGWREGRPPPREVIEVITVQVWPGLKHWLCSGKLCVLGLGVPCQPPFPVSLRWAWVAAPESVDAYPGPDLEGRDQR